MTSDGGKKYILSDVEEFAKKNSFNDTFKIAKTWEEIGFHVSALSYNGFRVITLSRLGSGVFQLFFSGDTFLKTRYTLGVIHDPGITQWTKDYIDNPYGIQRTWFNIKNGYQKDDKYHYKEFLKNKNKVNTNENMKKQTIKLNESQLRDMIKESIKKVLLKESERHEIFTLDIFDIENENGIDDMQYARDYESADEAIQAAREVAHKYADYDSVINVFVMAGEYMDKNGNIFGEPDAIYCISNKDKRTTMIARKNAGYSRLESDEYIG